MLKHYKWFTPTLWSRLILGQGTEFLLPDSKWEKTLRVFWRHITRTCNFWLTLLISNVMLLLYLGTNWFLPRISCPNKYTESPLLSHSIVVGRSCIRDIIGGDSFFLIRLEHLNLVRFLNKNINFQLFLKKSDWHYWANTDIYKYSPSILYTHQALFFIFIKCLAPIDITDSYSLLPTFSSVTCMFCYLLWLHSKTDFWGFK